MKHIKLVSILGIFVLFIGSAISLFLGIDLYHSLTNSFYPSAFHNLWTIGFMVFGVAYLVAGISLLTKTKWSLRFTLILFFASIVGWTRVVYKLFDDISWRINDSDFFINIGLAVFIYTILICGILFMENKKVATDFQNNLRGEIWEEDILDM